MTDEANILAIIERDKELWIPEWVDDPNPTDGVEDPEEGISPPNLPPDDTDSIGHPAGEAIVEPEVGRALGPSPERYGAYSDTYWTHFDWRADVARAVSRVQRKHPWQTFANTYYCHPPVYGRKYEFVSVDFWGGGLSGGHYTGYRGKPIGAELGNRVFNTLFHDPYLPNIYWVIWRGSMWTRGYGWGPAPWGPPDSDPGHHAHIHCTYVL